MTSSSGCRSQAPGAGDERVGGDRARAARAADLDAGLGGAEGGERVAGRIPEDERAGERRAVADLARGDGARRGGEAGQLTGVALEHVGVGHARAEADGVAVPRGVAQARNAGEIDQRDRLDPAVEVDEHAGPTGHDGRVGVRGTGREGVVEGAWLQDGQAVILS